MFYREAGQFKTTYQADQAVFPILQDRIGLAIILVGAFVFIPFAASDFFINVISSRALRAGTSRFAISTLGADAIRPTGVKSLRGSNPALG